MDPIARRAAAMCEQQTGRRRRRWIGKRVKRGDTEDAEKRKARDRWRTGPVGSGIPGNTDRQFSDSLVRVGCAGGVYWSQVERGGLGCNITREID
jgi:hypothetical protein